MALSRNKRVKGIATQPTHPSLAEAVKIDGLVQIKQRKGICRSQKSQIGTNDMIKALLLYLSVDIFTSLQPPLYRSIGTLKKIDRCSTLSNEH